MQGQILFPGQSDYYYTLKILVIFNNIDIVTVL